MKAKPKPAKPDSDKQAYLDGAYDRLRDRVVSGKADAGEVKNTQRGW